MPDIVTTSQELSDKKLLGLARELALDIKSMNSVLKEYDIDAKTFERVRSLPRFRMYFEQEVITWQSSLSAADRVRIKSAAAIEEWLPELYARMLDTKEPLSSKVEAGKLLAKMAEIGNARPGDGGGGGERFSVTINLGSDQTIKIGGEITPRVIDAEVVE